MAQLPVLFDVGHGAVTELPLPLRLGVALRQCSDPVGRSSGPQLGTRQAALGTGHQAAITRNFQRGLGRRDPLALLGHGAAHVREATRQVAAFHAELLEHAVVLVQLGTQPATPQLELRKPGPGGLELQAKLPAALAGFPEPAHRRSMLRQQRIEILL